jgi:H+/Na+-translocating ferredoxin:NAD+ oxidoreductase subunit E
MIDDRARPGEERFPLFLLALVPAVAVSGRVIDALWMSAGVLLVSVLSCIGRWLLDDTEAGRPSGGLEPPRALFRALVISSVLTAGFEAGLLAVHPAASAALGIYAPLIAVNLVVLEPGSPGTQSLRRSTVAAFGRGAAFAAGLLSIALAREALGAGTITLFPVGAFRGTLVIRPLLDQPVRALGAAGGALLCLGYLAGGVRWLARRSARAEEPR